MPSAKPRKPIDHHEARVEHLRQAAADRRGEEHGDAGDEHRLADHQRIIAAHLRRDRRG